MPNEQNIVPYRFTSEQNREEAAKNGRSGGRASGVSRRRKRSLKEAADLYLSLPVADQKKWNAISRQGVDPEDIDNQMAVIIGLTQRAMKGDAKAAKVVLDLIGENANVTAKDEREDDPLTVALKEELKSGV